MKSKIILLLLVVTISACRTVTPNENLSRAAIAGDLQTTQNLVKTGVMVNNIDKWGWTALMWSVYYGNIPVAKWLLEQGADPNIKSEKHYGMIMEGSTALILASSYGHSDAVDALLKKKADADYVDRKGKTALEYARESGCEQCILLLTKKNR